MSELQVIVGLAAAGLVGMVYAWSRWQEYRQQRLTRKMIPAQERDILLESRHDHFPVEPRLPADEGDAGGARAPLVSLVPAAAPETRLEYAVVLTGQVTGTALWQALHDSGLVTRGVRWVGQHQGLWVDILMNTTVQFEKVYALMQLTSRAGMVSEARLTLFMDELRGVAAQLGAVVSADDIGAAVQKAQQLERFCQQVDLVVGVNVVFTAIKAPTGTRLMSYLAQEGMVLGDDGVCHIRSQDGTDRFTLMRQDGAPFLGLTLDHETISAITLLFEVGRLVDPVAVFKEVFAVAERIALVLDGQVVDDRGERLGARQAAAIEKQLNQGLSTMETEGIPAGSALALRLFS
ncbi:MAG: hypothetical protein G3H99_01890 [Ferrovum sp.]|nr:hypothetical protein [Ferrovum sp.]NDU86944.1 hypothetical protein [Ferrovum sp.]